MTLSRRAHDAGMSQGLTFEALVHGERIFRFRPSLLVSLRPEDGLVTGTIEAFDAHVFASSKEAFNDEIAEHVAVLWDEYAQGDPTHMTKGARAVRDELLRRVTVEDA